MGKTRTSGSRPYGSYGLSFRGVLGELVDYNVIYNKDVSSHLSNSACVPGPKGMGWLLLATRGRFLLSAQAPVSLGLIAIVNLAH